MKTVDGASRPWVQIPPPPPFRLGYTSLVAAGERAADPGLGSALWHVERPLRLARWLDGVRYDGYIERSSVLRVYGCRGGTFRTKLAAGPEQARVFVLHDESTDAITLRANGARPIEVRLRPRRPLGKWQCTIQLLTSAPVTLKGRTSFEEPPR